MCVCCDRLDLGPLDLSDVGSTNLGIHGSGTIKECRLTAALQHKFCNANTYTMDHNKLLLLIEAMTTSNMYTQNSNLAFLIDYAMHDLRLPVKLTPPQ
jgi:hypothetical protein